MDNRPSSSALKSWAYKVGTFSLKERGAWTGSKEKSKTYSCTGSEDMKYSWETEDRDRISFTIENTLTNMIIADVNPQLAIRHLITLSKKSEFHKAANFITRMNPTIFQRILADFPIDSFLNVIPQSLPVFEVLYSKVLLTNELQFSLKALKPDAFIMKLVKYYADQNIIYLTNGSSINSNCDQVTPTCKNILRMIHLSDPKISLTVLSNRKALGRAIEALGAHGLIDTSEDGLMNLHDALRIEFERRIHAYKQILQRIDEMYFSGFKTINSVRSINYGPAPINASHQRQLSLRESEIHNRLLKNRSLLNAIEPIFQNHSLEMLLRVLSNRVQSDKDVLFQFQQLKRQVSDDGNSNPMVAPILMRFSNGCNHILRMLKEFSDDEDQGNSDISGYHSDCDSTVMIGKTLSYTNANERDSFLRCSGK